ncbi:hypothetical protein JCM9534A_77250 [Catenuloplanes indicus JCM 9534]
MTRRTLLAGTGGVLLLGHANVWFTADFVDLGGATGMGRLSDWIEAAGGIASFNYLIPGSAVRSRR